MLQVHGCTEGYSQAITRRQEVYSNTPPQTHSFKRYAALVTEQLVPKYKAAEHWAKIELPEDARARAAMVARVQVRGGVWCVSYVYVCASCTTHQPHRRTIRVHAFLQHENNWIHTMFWEIL